MNSRKWFSTFKPNKRDNLGVIYTGGGLVKPLGKGTAVFKVLVKEPDTYNEIKLLDALYCLNFDVNLISGLRHYKAGGSLVYRYLKDSKKNTIALLNLDKTGFFLPLEGYPTPTSHL